MLDHAASAMTGCSSGLLPGPGNGVTATCVHEACELVESLRPPECWPSSAPRWAYFRRLRQQPAAWDRSW